MATYTEQRRINELIVWELAQEHGWCRTTGLFKQNASATADVPVGQVTENDSGKFKVLATGANANGILLTRVPKEKLIAGDVPVVVLTRGPALVVEEALTVAANQAAAAKAALKALGIELRNEPATQEVGTV